jgi:hypothetical protein
LVPLLLEGLALGLLGGQGLSRLLGLALRGGELGPSRLVTAEHEQAGAKGRGEQQRDDEGYGSSHKNSDR